MQSQLFSRFAGLSIVGLTLAIGILGSSGRAIAEGNCADGYTQQLIRTGAAQGDAEAVNGFECVPIPGYQSNGDNYNNAPLAPKYKEVSVRSYGAIARDPVKNKIGMGGALETHNSKKKAEREAIKKCRDAGGGDDCKIVLSIVDSCAAITMGIDKTAMELAFIAVEVKKDNEDLAMVKKTCTDKYSDCTEVVGFCTTDLIKTVRNKRFFGLFN